MHVTHGSMISRSYSFLDVAVLETVGTRFAAGEALVILSERLDVVLWTNGAGARLFGFSDIFSFIGADPQLPLPVRRQIEATPGYPELGSGRPLALRLAHGMTSRAIAFTASSVIMPDGENAILLAAPDATAGTRLPQEVAERAIAGLSDEGQFVALVDDKGMLAAASAGFSDLGITGDTLRDLADEVAGERDRLVKRLVPAAGRSLPAGMARLTDTPGLNLLMIIDEAGTETVSSDGPDAGQAPAPDSLAEAAVAAETPAAGTRAIDAPFEVEEAAVSAQAEETPVQESPPAPVEEQRGATVQAASSTPPAGDEWYFDSGERSGGRRDTPAASSASLPQPPAELAAMPVRFVWRTDANGCFSTLSDEFRNVFGAEAADVIGRRFADVASVFGLDPDGEIAGLLERRDTWSGRSVLWPVAGTDLKVPVDLAALPVYGRERNFEGFRGFGVARMGDAVVDPEAIGLALRPPAAEASETAAEQASTAAPDTDSASPDDETAGSEHEAAAADPFRGEVPALQVSPGPERRQSDKVIQLAERRPNGTRGLSAAEQLNFDQIGERLRNAGLVGEPLTGTETQEPAGPAEAPERTDVVAGEDQPTVNTDTPEGEAPAAESAAQESLQAAETPSGVEEADTAHAPDTAEEPARQAEGAKADGTDSEAGESALSREKSDAPLSAETPEAEAPLDEAPYVEPSVESPDAGAASEEPPARSTEVFLPSAFAGLSANRHLPGIDAAVLSQLPLPVLIHAGDALFYANREFLQLTGYPSLAELEHAGGLGAIFGDPYGPEETAERKLRLRTRDGEEFPVDAFLQSVAWNGGKALLLALKRTEGAEVVPLPQAPAPAAETEADLEARLAELRTIIDTATDGVVIIGNDGRIRSISRPAEALFGFNGFDVVGHDFASLFAIESQKAAADYLAGLAENGVASVLNDGREVIGREAQGRFIPLFMTIGRLPNDSGFCAVLRDITQWKRAEEELTQARAEAERASSQKTEFLARVSHEIRTPLNAIIGFSELMVDEKFGPIGNDRYKDYLRDINKSGNHVLDLVNDLLDISKIEAGQQEMSYEAVSLSEVLGEAVAMMQPQANRERVIIRSSFTSRLPEVVADLRSVRQIALNLLSNAIRYTPAGGQVIVSTAYEQSGDIVMRVRDTGIGMAAADIEQALKPFKQINALKRPRGDGTGLGLPLTKAMVEANRARFAIHSTPGEGTLVEITFPSTRVLAH